MSTTADTPSPSPSPTDIGELLLDCRYGDLHSVHQFVESYGIAALAHARDQRQNTVLHMCAANGHDDILSYILSLPSLPPSLLTSTNDAGNTPLHWACLNTHLACAKRLVAFRPGPGTGTAPSLTTGENHTSDADADADDDDKPPKLGPALILAPNDAGHTPLGEAERAGWVEGARWLVSVMDLDLASSASSHEQDASAAAEANSDDEHVCLEVDHMAQNVEADLAQLRVSDSEPPLDDSANGSGRRSS